MSVGDGVGGGASAPLVPLLGLVLAIGSGSEDELGVAAEDGVLDDDGDALASRPHNALETGSDDGDEPDVGVALPDGSAGADGLPDGRPDGSGPGLSAAKEVAATEAKMAAVVAPKATERRVISVHLRTDLPPRVVEGETAVRAAARRKVRRY